MSDIRFGDYRNRKTGSVRWPNWGNPEWDCKWWALSNYWISKLKRMETPYGYNWIPLAQTKVIQPLRKRASSASVSRRFRLTNFNSPIDFCCWFSERHRMHLDWMINLKLAIEGTRWSRAPSITWAHSTPVEIKLHSNNPEVLMLLRELIYQESSRYSI